MLAKSVAGARAGKWRAKKHAAELLLHGVLGS
jgi:hypothetical protein